VKNGNGGKERQKQRLLRFNVHHVIECCKDCTSSSVLEFNLATICI
jgi:hypothetical protein